MKKLICVLLTAAMLLCSFCGCAKKDAAISTGEIGVVKDEEFGNVYIDFTVDGFNAIGFKFGDSVDISFSNGKCFEDIPYFSGYYVPIGEMLLCGYPGYPHPVVARNYGSGTWEEFAADEKMKVTVTLREEGKYLAAQELFALEYSDDRSKYDSDIMFANFREVKGGNIKEGAFYRSASPCDDQHKRASYANALAEEYKIAFALNLSDNETKYEAYTKAENFVSFYYDSLKKDGKVLLLALNANYRADSFAKAVSEAFVLMSENEGPCLIHCVEGKDRTGFVCALLLALADASPREVVDDYMITYYNYYRITKEEKPDKYEAILGNVYDFLYCLCDAEKGSDIESLDLKKGAEDYLRRGGLSEEQIQKIEGYISE